jgi:hypothetical protein
MPSDVLKDKLKYLIGAFSGEVSFFSALKAPGAACIPAEWLAASCATTSTATTAAISSTISYTNKKVN